MAYPGPGAVIGALMDLPRVSLPAICRALMSIHTTDPLNSQLARAYCPSAVKSRWLTPAVGTRME
jgi:hypothetical protein